MKGINRRVWQAAWHTMEPVEHLSFGGTLAILPQGITYRTLRARNGLFLIYDCLCVMFCFRYKGILFLLLLLLLLLYVETPTRSVSKTMSMQKLSRSGVAAESLC